MVNEQHIVDILNDLLEKDQSSMIALLSLVVPTTSKVLEDYDVRFGSRANDYPQLGLITILNKIIENPILSNWSCKSNLSITYFQSV